MTDLQQRLELVQADGRLPSLVGGVLRDGGLAEVAGVRADPGTGYRVGSITKTFTAVLVMQLRDEGALALDDPVGRWLPEAGYGEATVEQLLSHTGGLQSEPVGPWWERSDGGDFAGLAAANDGSGRVAGAGEWYHYSNLGYGLLGELVARLRGAPWWDVVSERLLVPLGMTRTTYGPQPPHAQGHSVEHFTGRLVDEPHADTGAMAPAGQAWSTVADLARWAGVLAGRCPDVLAPATLEEMRTERLGGYGLGLRLVAHDDRVLGGHTGSMPGFLASLFVDPATGDGTVALADATTGLTATDVPRLLLGPASGLPSPVGPVPWVPTTRLPAGVADVPGLWFWGSTAFDVRWHGDRLQLWRLQSGTLEEQLELRDGRLVGVAGYHRGETLHVVRRDDGSVSHLECATFVYTRVPYDPDVEIPGGHPAIG